MSNLPPGADTDPRNPANEPPDYRRYRKVHITIEIEVYEMAEHAEHHASVAIESATGGKVVKTELID